PTARIARRWSGRSAASWRKSAYNIRAGRRSGVPAVEAAPGTTRGGHGMKRGWFTLLAIVGVAALAGAPAAQQAPIQVGLAAAVSGGSAASGEAIKRGLSIALDEVNARGGLLGGRKLELVVRDDEGKPQKGVAIARELVGRGEVAAVVGGRNPAAAR